MCQADTLRTRGVCAAAVRSMRAVRSLACALALCAGAAAFAPARPALLLAGGQAPGAASPPGRVSYETLSAGALVAGALRAAGLAPAAPGWEAGLAAQRADDAHRVLAVLLTSAPPGVRRPGGCRQPPASKSRLRPCPARPGWPSGRA